MRAPHRIESRDNRRLVEARKVRDGRIPGLIFVEGKRLAAEALTSGLVVERCITTDPPADQRMIEECSIRGIETYYLDQKLFRTVADTDAPQDILLIARRPRSELPHIVERLSIAVPPVVIFLSKINNPSNLGAIIRTAEAAGAAGVICSTGSADPFSPKALRGSMGSAFRLPIVTGMTIEDLAKFAGDHDLIMTATTADAASSYLDIDWTKPRIVLFGPEAHGLDEFELGVSESRISIPMAGRVESLNLAVSAGIILFEARRQCEVSAGR
jgi:TrmH family RNA methyltransferase